MRDLISPAVTTPGHLQAGVDHILDHWADWLGQQPCIAVSGGSDSTALLLLASDWAARRGRALHVLTVNHGVRAGAANDVAHVAALSRGLGHACTPLTLEGARAVQASLRTARHIALADAARDIGTKAVLLGHTLDDQLETHLMRKAADSSAYGLGGIDVAGPSPAWPEGRGLTLIRPLRQATRVALRELLRGAGVNWRDDPSNENMAFERVRVRSDLSDSGLRDEAMHAQAAAFATRRQIQRAMAQAFHDHLTAHPDGTLTLEIGSIDGAIAARCLSIAMQLAAGRAAPVRLPQITRLLAQAADGFSKGARQTAGGCWIALEASGALRIARDPGAVVAGWRAGVWDGRFAAGSGDGALRDVHPMARPGLPEGCDGYALAPGRLDHICKLWAHAE